MSNLVSLEKTDRANVILFVRPEQRNPLSAAVLREIVRIIEEIERDPNPMKIVFTGSGEVFASGADLREIAALAPEDARDFARFGQATMERISNFSPGAVAAVNGPCYGGALDLALACRRRIASPNSTYCHPGAGLGIITGWGGTQRLPRLVGEGRALELLFTAAPISAVDALGIGLVDEISDHPLRAALSS